MSTFEIVISMIAAAGALAEVFSFVLTFFVLREVGELDGDKDDWWERKNEVE